MVQRKFDRLPQGQFVAVRTLQFGDGAAHFALLAQGGLYWVVDGGGWVPLDALNHEVIATYAETPYRLGPRHRIAYDGKLCESSLIAFDQEFPSPGHASPYLDNEQGWISPEGVFYPRHSLSYQTIARDLLAQSYGRLGGVAELEAAGWVNVSDDGVVGVIGGARRVILTSAQDGCLQQMEAEAIDPYRRRNLSAAREHYPVAPEVGIS